MSYETILKDLPEDFIRKMRNWARGNCGASNYAMTSAYDGFEARSGFSTSPPPVLGGEVTDVDAALMSVPNRYRQAVCLFWQYEGRSLRWFGRHLACDHHTVEGRVRHGHDLVRAQLAINRQRSDRYHQLAAISVAAAPGHSVPLPAYKRVVIPPGK